MNKKYISLFILTIGLINHVFADRGGWSGFHDNRFHWGGGEFHGGEFRGGDRLDSGDRVYGGDRFYGGGFWDGIVGGLAGTWLIGSLFNGWGNNNYNNGGGYYSGGSGGCTTNNYYTVIQIKIQTLIIKMIHMVNNQLIIQQLSKMVVQMLDIGYLV